MSEELSSLAKEMMPPPELRAAIAGELRRAGLLRRSRVPLLAAAAAVIVAVIGIAILMTHRAPVQPNYILLLYDTPHAAGGSRAEYAAWARDMRPLVVGGEELGDATLLAAPSQPSERVAGYVLIRAKDDAEAERVAHACPHLRHGGGVVLRRIVL